MSKKVVSVATFLIISAFFFSVGFAQENSEKSGYIIGAGDVLEVSVWNHTDLIKTMRVRPDGWISFPLAGEVRAAGTQPAQLSEAIRQKLLSFLKDPQVSVIVTEYTSKKVLVLGEVKKPGIYQYEGGMTAFEAIGTAEGYNKHAQLKSIVVIRNAYSSAPKFYIVNLYKAIHDGSMAGNMVLQSRDIVYVPQNFIGNAGDFMDYWVSRVKPAADSYFLGAIAANQ